MALPYVGAFKSSAETDVRRTEEALFWTRLKRVAVFSEPSQISSISMSSKHPFLVASTAGLRLSLFDSVLCEQNTVMTRFKKAVFGVTFRSDGNLIALGGEEGKLRIMDCYSTQGAQKAALRTWKASSAALHATGFASSGRWVYSLGDDGTLKQWDFSSNGSSALASFQAHEDASRVLVPSPSNDFIVLTAGYDHTAKLWDVRTSNEGASITLDCQSPVEDAEFLPREQVVAVAAGPSVRLFDLSTGRQLGVASHHNKAVTSLSLCRGGQNLMSGGVDKRLNVLRTSDLSLVHSVSLPSSILALASSPDDNHVAVGMGNLVALHQREEKKKDDDAVELKTIASNTTKAVVAEKGEKREVQRKGISSEEYRLSQEDTMLRKFRHAAVINKVFSGKASKAREMPDIVVGWLGVIVSRGAMARALAGQPNNVLANIARFVSRHLFKSAYFETLCAVAEELFVVSSSAPSLVPFVLRLSESVRRELSVQKELMQVMGALEMMTVSLDNGDSASANEELFGDPVFTTIPLDLTTDPKKESIKD